MDELKVEEIPVIAAVVRQDDRYLICQRPTHKRHGGLWEFPGGKIEAGETGLDAARRELREELAVEVTEVRPSLFTIQDPGSPFVIHFAPALIAGAPKCIEHSALKWADLPELMQTELAPSDRRFVEFLSRG
jgi:mutator protein MutT